MTEEDDTRGAHIVEGERDESGPGPDIMASHSLAGDAVFNGEGERLGEIKAIMLDVRQGRIAYAVMSFGGFLGLGETLFAIPWGALVLDSRRNCFILDMDRERLKTAPGFERDRWPKMSDAGWACDVHDFYGVTPYWN